MMDGGDAVTSGGGKSRGGGGGAHDSDLLDDSILRETENPFLDVLLSGFQRKPEKKNFHFKFDELARTECMIAKQNLINVCKSSRYCQNSDSMRLSVEEMCTEYDELIEMSYHAAEQLLMILYSLSDRDTILKFVPIVSKHKKRALCRGAKYPGGKITRGKNVGAKLLRRSSNIS
ncbi:uncharacterized protein [Lepeophtheirus salmonis]|uniref:uncharacterized protein isoform X1 n=1 Tax=Lepeophtheirus salmonis TaxID=72036 RepID=UPI001AE5ED3A|nr:uncharacterized protein LOC121128607 [Lepeophtheirus salmonis]XP_040580136.1 uncharacterized protein LOC121128607 [Lepeophtheirus salmonis]